MPPQPLNPKELAIHGLTQAQPAMRRYIMAAVLDYNAMEEILQETNLALWRKISKFDGTREFLPWALAFARMQIMAFRKRNPGGRFVNLDERTLGSLATDAAAMLPDEDSRLAHLGFCIAKLAPKDRKLLDLRYSESLSLREISGLTRRSEGSLQQLFFRIRAGLRACVERRMQNGGLA